MIVVAAMVALRAASSPYAYTRSAAATMLNAGSGSRMCYNGSGCRGLGRKSHRCGNRLHVRVFGDVFFVSSARAIANAAQRARGSRLVVGASAADCIGGAHASGRALVFVSRGSETNGTIAAMIYCTWYRPPTRVPPIAPV